MTGPRLNGARWGNGYAEIARAIVEGEWQTLAELEQLIADALERADHAAYQRGLKAPARKYLHKKEAENA